MKKIATVCFICCLMASTAFARGCDDRTFVMAGQIDLFVPSNDFHDINSKIGSNITVDGQFFFSEHFGVGLNLGHIGYSTDNFTANSRSFEYDISSWILGLSFIGRIPLTRWDIYGLLGVGFAYNIYELSYEESDINFIQRETDTGAAFRIEAGGRYYVSYPFSIGLTAGYLINEMDADYVTNNVFVEETEKLGGFYIGFTAAMTF